MLWQPPAASMDENHSRHFAFDSLWKLKDTEHGYSRVVLSPVENVPKIVRAGAPVVDLPGLASSECCQDTIWCRLTARKCKSGEYSNQQLYCACHYHSLPYSVESRYMLFRMSWA